MSSHHMHTEYHQNLRLSATAVLSSRTTSQSRATVKRKREMRSRRCRIVARGCKRPRRETLVAATVSPK